MYRTNSRTDGCGYLDGIPVKIGEKFKPPIKITLPINYQQRNPTDILNDDYDFSLETQILETAEQRRRLNQERERAKEEDVASRIEQFTRLGSTQRSDSSDGSPTESCNIPSSGDSSETTEHQNPQIDTTNSHLITQFQTKNILTPETANQTPRSETQPQPSQNTIKLEDFEAESSPFDSVELKTLNDMEELKSVLQNFAEESSQIRVINNGKTSEPSVQYRHSNGIDNISTSKVGYPSCQNYPQYPVTSSTTLFDGAPTTYSTFMCTESMTWNLPQSIYKRVPDTNGAFSYDGLGLPMYENDVSNSNVPTLRAARSTPDLLSEVVGDVTGGSLHLPRPNSVGSVQTSNSETSCFDPFEELDESGKMLTRQMVDMGFPKERVARAVLKLGVDDKKVVEHLCCVQSMVESGFDAVRAESALHLHNQDQKEAQAYLQLVKQFMDLGFEEHAIERALKLHENDRDKALDYLVS